MEYKNLSITELQQGDQIINPKNGKILVVSEKRIDGNACVVYGIDNVGNKDYIVGVKATEIKVVKEFYLNRIANYSKAFDKYYNKQEK